MIYPSQRIDTTVGFKPSGKVRERSVDSLQRLYAFVIGFSAVDSLKTIVLAVGKDKSAAIDVIPQFIAFIFLAIPFFHGMNRHLDSTYVFAKNPKIKPWIIIDFAVFMLISFAFAAMAVSISNPLLLYYIAVGLILVDCSWLFAIHRRTGEYAAKWLIVNYCCAAFIVVFLNQHIWKDSSGAYWMCAGFVVIRACLDYWFCWDFYFPEVDESQFGFNITPTPSIVEQPWRLFFEAGRESEVRIDGQSGVNEQIR